MHDTHEPEPPPPETFASDHSVCSLPACPTALDPDHSVEWRVTSPTATMHDTHDHASPSRETFDAVEWRVHDTHDASPAMHDTHDHACPSTATSDPVEAGPPNHHDDKVEWRVGHIYPVLAGQLYFTSHSTSEDIVQAIQERPELLFFSTTEPESYRGYCKVSFL